MPSIRARHAQSRAESTSFMDRAAGPAEMEALGNMEEVGLHPNMSRSFDENTIRHIYEAVLPEAIKRTDVKQVRLIEQVLAKYGWAKPNHLSGYWEPMEVPHTELQVRELFAHKLSEFGYQLVASHTDFPDWLLVDQAGNFLYTEVEHRSSSFGAHEHDPNACDLVACWEHDWPECPLPVLEFFSGCLFKPTEPIQRLCSNPKAQVNFSTALSRHAPGKSRYLKYKEGQDVLNNYRDLVRGGASYTEAIRLLAASNNVPTETVRKRLRYYGVRAPGRGQGTAPRKVAQVKAHVEALTLEGTPRSEAIKDAAQKFGLARNTVYVYLKRE